MPIHWKISHADRLVMVRTEGEVGLKDVEAYLDDVVTQDAMGYGKLFDASEISPVASDHDLMMLAARVRAYASTMTGGPLAFVATAPAPRAIIERYINLADAARPVAIFATVEEARRWLESQRQP